ncbi:MAG: YfhO family protein [Candidatus Wallbacteria bacterium]|nr:YfhO family protein [Candidatus Wallbacteria bacterium]
MTSSEATKPAQGELSSPLPLEETAGAFRGLNRFDLLWLAGLWALAVLFFWQVLFEGQTFYFRDTVTSYYPQASVTARALAQGRIPHWEPTIGCGYPFQADPHSMVFYPLMALFLLLPFARAYSVFVALHVPLGGTFLYLLLRRWALSAPAAALGAVSLMFCGYTISTTCLTTLLRGTIWAPLALLAFDGFAMNSSWRAVLATALVLAVQGSSTDPQYVLFTGMLLAVYPWMRPGAPRLSPRLHLKALLATAALAATLLAYQYLPLAQLISLSDRSTAADSDELGSFGVEPTNLYNLIVPVPFPDPISPFYLMSYRAGMVPFYPDVYVGLPILALALASLGLGAGSLRRDGGAAGRLGASARVVLGVAFASLLVSLEKPMPFFSLLTTVVPPLRLFRYPGKYFLITAIALAISAALGLQGLLERRPLCEKLYRRTLDVGVLLAAALLLLVGVFGPQLVRVFLSADSSITGDASIIVDTVSRGWMANLGFVFGIVLAVRGLLHLADRGKLNPGKALALAMTLAVADLSWTTSQGFPTIADHLMVQSRQIPQMMGAPSPTGTPPRYVSYSPQQLRFDSEKTTSQFMLLQTILMSHLRGAIDGCDMLLSTMSVRLASMRQLLELITRADRNSRDRVAAALGAGHALRMEPFQVGTDVGKTVAEVGAVLVQQLPDVTPRAFIAPRARAAATGESLFTVNKMLSLPHVSIYEVPPSGQVTDSLVPRKILGCAITRHRQEEVRIDFGLEGDGLLVLLDTFHPSWVAAVDGHPREILRTGGMFRGVPVHGGEHSLVMTYVPTPFRVGFVISLVALTLTLAGLTVGQRLGAPA